MNKASGIRPYSQGWRIRNFGQTIPRALRMLEAKSRNHGDRKSPTNGGRIAMDDEEKQMKLDDAKEAVGMAVTGKSGANIEIKTLIVGAQPRRQIAFGEPDRLVRAVDVLR